MKLGTKVRELRLEMGWTQQKLADEAGVAGSYISRLEGDGFKTPSAEVLLRLAGALKVDVKQLYQTTGHVREGGGSRPLEAILREAQERCDLLATVEVSMRGKVPTTYPDPEEDNNNYIFIPKEVLNMAKGKVFAYRCASDCLVQDGILPEDYIIVDPKAPFVDGQIYVVRVGNRVVVSHIYLAGDKLRLILSGGEYEERDKAEVEIWGRVVLAGHWKTF